MKDKRPFLLIGGAMLAVTWVMLKGGSLQTVLLILLFCAVVSMLTFLTPETKEKNRNDSITEEEK
ncbi:hypothetical protein NXH76_06665 [Blautia schinkii]|nr:hypothetical protein [Blautia schinkii]